MLSKSFFFAFFLFTGAPLLAQQTEDPPLMGETQESHEKDSLDVRTEAKAAEQEAYLNAYQMPQMLALKTAKGTFSDTDLENVFNALISKDLELKDCTLVESLLKGISSVLGCGDYSGTRSRNHSYSRTSNSENNPQNKSLAALTNPYLEVFDRVKSQDTALVQRCMDQLRNSYFFTGSRIKNYGLNPSTLASYLMMILAGAEQEEAELLGGLNELNDEVEAWSDKHLQVEGMSVLEKRNLLIQELEYKIALDNHQKASGRRNTGPNKLSCRGGVVEASSWLEEESQKFQDSSGQVLPLRQSVKIEKETGKIVSSNSPKVFESKEYDQDYKGHEAAYLQTNYEDWKELELWEEYDPLEDLERIAMLWRCKDFGGLVKPYLRNLRAYFKKNPESVLDVQGLMKSVLNERKISIPKTRNQITSYMQTLVTALSAQEESQEVEDNINRAVVNIHHYKMAAIKNGLQSPSDCRAPYVIHAKRAGGKEANVSSRLEDHLPSFSEEDFSEEKEFGSIEGKKYTYKFTAKLNVNPDSAIQKLLNECPEIPEGVEGKVFCPEPKEAFGLISSHDTAEWRRSGHSVDAAYATGYGKSTREPTSWEDVSLSEPHLNDAVVYSANRYVQECFPIKEDGTGARAVLVRKPGETRLGEAEGKDYGEIKEQFKENPKYATYLKELMSTFSNAAWSYVDHNSNVDKDAYFHVKRWLDAGIPLLDIPGYNLSDAPFAYYYGRTRSKHAKDTAASFADYMNKANEERGGLYHNQESFSRSNTGLSNLNKLSSYANVMLAEAGVMDGYMWARQRLRDLADKERHFRLFVERKDTGAEDSSYKALEFFGPMQGRGKNKKLPYINVSVANLDSALGILSAQLANNLHWWKTPEACNAKP